MYQIFFYENSVQYTLWDLKRYLDDCLIFGLGVTLKEWMSRNFFYHQASTFFSFLSPPSAHLNKKNLDPRLHHIMKNYRIMAKYHHKIMMIYYQKIINHHHNIMKYYHNIMNYHYSPMNDYHSIMNYYNIMNCRQNIM